jgi:hypothetical protein
VQAIVIDLLFWFPEVMYILPGGNNRMGRLGTVRHGLSRTT